MTKKPQIADVSKDLKPAQNLSIEIVTFQSGEIIRTIKGV